MEFFRNVCNDVQVLRSIWFGKITGDTHKERLESFYGPQAHVCKYFLASLPLAFVSQCSALRSPLINFVVLSLEIIVCVVYYAYLFLIVGKGFWSGVDGVSSLRRMMRWFQIILNCNLLGSCVLWRFFFVLYSIPLWSWQCERVFDVDGFSSLRITLRCSQIILNCNSIRFVSLVILPFCLRCSFSRSALRLP